MWENLETTKTEDKTMYIFFEKMDIFVPNSDKIIPNSNICVWSMAK